MKKVLIFLIGLVVVSIISTIFFFQSFNQNSLFPQDLTPITEKEMEAIYDLIIEEGGKEIIDGFGSLFLEKESLVNVVHVVKGFTYQVSCRLGPAYKTVNLDRFFPGELISLGQIKKCDIETAQKIDQVITSGVYQCSVPLYSDKSQLKLNDYYLITLVLEEREITQELIDRYDKNRICSRPLEKFMGEISPTVLVGIVDLIGGHIYY